jgi:hypothetical protein
MADKDPKWYFQTWSLVISFIIIGPFMLPLVWTNPRFTRKAKVIISILVILFTFLLSVIVVKTFGFLNDFYNQLLEAQN